MYLTKGAYAQFLKLGQYDKLCAIKRFKERGLRLEDLHMLELAYEVSKPEVKEKMFSAVNA